MKMKMKVDNSEEEDALRLLTSMPPYLVSTLGRERRRKGKWHVTSLERKTRRTIVTLILTLTLMP